MARALVAKELARGAAQCPRHVSERVRARVLVFGSIEFWFVVEPTQDKLAELRQWAAESSLPGSSPKVWIDVASLAYYGGGNVGEEARAEELATVRRIKVWIKVDRNEAIRETGRPPIKLRWVDINKGDELNPRYRSRIVAKEIRTDNRMTLLACNTINPGVEVCDPRGNTMLSH